MLAAVRQITDPAPGGLGTSQRSVTVSTVGLAPAIRKLADEGLQVRLAVSLHTPDDELRDTRGQEIAAACGQLAARLIEPAEAIAAHR